MAATRIAAVVMLGAAAVSASSEASSGSLRGSAGSHSGVGGEASSGSSEAAPESTLSQLASASRSIAKVLHVGDASASQIRTILDVTSTCFERNPVSTASIGDLDSTLGGAVGCVEGELQSAWGWKPTIDNYGSGGTGDQGNGYGLGSTVVEVETDSGTWMYVLKLEGASIPETTPAAHSWASSSALQQGDASDAKLADILGATTSCFQQNSVDTSNMGQLQFTLGTAVECVQSECEQSWGWRPRVDSQGSHSCGRCDGYGLGATVIAVNTPSGDWMFVMRLM